MQNDNLLFKLGETIMAGEEVHVQTYVAHL